MLSLFDHVRTDGSDEFVLLWGAITRPLSTRSRSGSAGPCRSGGANALALSRHAPHTEPRRDCVTGRGHDAAPARAASGQAVGIEPSLYQRRVTQPHGLLQ